jgi:hypothetical protein
VFTTSGVYSQEMQARAGEGRSEKKNTDKARNAAVTAR